MTMGLNLWLLRYHVESRTIVSQALGVGSVYKFLVKPGSPDIQL